MRVSTIARSFRISSVSTALRSRSASIGPEWGTASFSKSRTTTISASQLRTPANRSVPLLAVLDCPRRGGVHELDLGVDGLLGLVERGEPIDARIGDADHADLLAAVGVRHRGAGAEHEDLEHGGLPGSGQTENTDAFHVSVLEWDMNATARGDTPRAITRKDRSNLRAAGRRSQSGRGAGGHRTGSRIPIRPEEPTSACPGRPGPAPPPDGS